MFATAEKLIKAIQIKTLNALEEQTNSIGWQKDNWHYKPGQGGGLTIIGKDSNIIEKAGVNFSSIANNKIIDSATTKRPELKNSAFKACGTSIIIHPHNPYVPTTHANFRFFEAITTNNKKIWWFGGGFDLTPYYPFVDDCILWHKLAKQACDKYDPNIYYKFKNWCDTYFYLPHRKEPRGIGGIFFDDLNIWQFNKCLNFIEDTSNAFLKAYILILSKRKNIDYSCHQDAFKCYRRGRYVEFNLLYDRGTKFGLESKGRTESILASLPPKVYWNNNFNFNLDEKELLNFLNKKDWI